MSIHLRPYDPRERETLLALFRGAIREIASRDYTPEQVEAWAMRGTLEKLADRPVWVAEMAGEVAGFVDLLDNGHIDMLFVHPERQRRGVAQALYSAVEAEARRRGLDRLTVDASHTARGFFERQDFTVEVRQTVQIDGIDMDNFRMVKALI